MAVFFKTTGVWLLLFSGWISILYTVDMSGYGFGTSSIPVLKYMPYEIALVSLVLFVVSIRIRSSRFFIMMTTFFLAMAIGAFYALSSGKAAEDTYVGRSLGAIVFFACYWLSFDRRYLNVFLKIYLWSMLIGAIVMALVMIIFRLGVIGGGHTQIYHPDFLLVSSSVFLLPILIRGRIERKLLLFLLIPVGFITGKATSALIALIIVYMLILRSGFQKKIDSSPRSVRVGIKGAYFLFAIFSVIILLFSADSVISSRLTEHSTEVRSLTMALRFGEFISSPLYGDVFTGSPMLQVSYLHIPSHSDILDLLAFGGSLSICLFFIPLLIVMKRTFKIHDTNDQWQGWATVLVFAYLVAMFVNPVLAVPRLAFHFFAAIGLLLGNYSYMRYRERVGAGPN